VKLLLSTNGYKIKVSDEDFEYLNQWSWNVLLHDGIPNSIRRKDEFGVPVWMSHNILRHRGVVIQEQVDHKDRDPLNNQFENLRLATVSQNLANRGLFKNSQTGYKGVTYRKDRGVYHARIQRTHLGYFRDPTLAAKAYDRAARALFGAFAVLNFPGV
jgi:hypothetical protein